MRLEIIYDVPPIRQGRDHQGALITTYDVSIYNDFITAVSIFTLQRLQHLQRETLPSFIQRVISPRFLSYIISQYYHASGGYST